MSPRIFGYFSVGNVVWLIFRSSVVLNSAGSGVISVVVVVLLGLIVRLLFFVHVYMVSR